MNDNHTDITNVTARILTLIGEETPKLNPSSSDFDVESMFYRMSAEFPHLQPDDIHRAFDAAHLQIIERHLLMVQTTVTTTGTLQGAEGLLRLARAAGCPDDAALIPWLRARGLVEEVEGGGGWRLKPAKLGVVT